MIKTWIVTQLFYPDETSTGYVMTKIAETLADVSEVNVICGSSSYQSNKLNTDNTIDGRININRINTPKLDKNKLINRVFLFFYFTIAVFFKIVFKIKKDDKLILVTNPPTLLVVIGFLKRIKKFKLIIILQDIFPENAVASGIIKTKSISYQYILKAINYGYKSADQLIACGSDMADFFVKKGITKNKITIIPNWADHLMVLPDSTINRQEYFNLNLENKIVIEFAGNIGRVQGLEKFIDLFNKMSNPNLVLIIIGDGAHKKLLQDLVLFQNISNVYFFESKPRNEQHLFLNSCDIGLVTLCEGMYGLGVPSKVYNIMSAAKPILYIGDKGSEIDLYINNEDIGWSFNWEKENAIISFLNDIAQSELLKRKGENARKFVLANFTEYIVFEEYKKVLTRNI